MTGAIKIIGVGSLGLLTSSLAYQSIKQIPQLINQVEIYDKDVYENLKLNGRLNKVLAGLASASFYLAYKFSPINAKHPYLIYALVGTVVSYGYTFVNSMEDVRKVRKFKAPKASGKEAKPVKTEEEIDELGKSYIHVSDEESTSTSTPSGSAPNSPITKANNENEDIEYEINLALFKKEIKNCLLRIKQNYLVSASGAGVSLLLATVGIIGETFM